MTKRAQLSFVSLEEIQKIRNEVKDPIILCELLSEILRINILYMIKMAGSGHIGTCFSSIDIMLWLWLHEMRHPNQPHLEYSDTFFSSKGHDAPALYATLTSLEFLDFELIHRLRRLGGLPGHPDIRTPFIAANTGSLGMGISKARGMAIANRLDRKHGKFFVMTGDGELQEGQIWESLQPAFNGKFSEITVIVDRNMIQSDMRTSEVSDLGRLAEKFKSFGWIVTTCNGHNFSELRSAFNNYAGQMEAPHVIIANTIKGRGVSFMESIDEDGLYKYHSGAPSDDDYYAALAELTSRANDKLHGHGLGSLVFTKSESISGTTTPNASESLIRAYGNKLLELGGQRDDIVVLDGDLMKDCGLLPFKQRFPERFIECGIAEQDMVSVAGGLALRGKLPIVHSFACFLSTRPNEQIYNNASEGKKIIYVGSLAGLIPSPPGHSHQSVRDVSSLGAMPNLTIVQPCNEEETRLCLEWAVLENNDSTYIRLVSVPQELDFALPQGYRLKRGCGVNLRFGTDAAIVTYGPTLLRQATIAASEIEMSTNKTVAVFNLPWLNFIDPKWLDEELSCYKILIVLDDHYITGGLGRLFAASMIERPISNVKIRLLGIKELPTCGQNDEVLRHHGLDAKTIAELLKKELPDI